MEVTFPRFKTTVSLKLREQLIALGMKDAFYNADFSGMFEGGGPNISAVVHQAFVSVDEAGTKAAAATAVIMTDSLTPSVRVDRPFLFLIRDRRTGSILFLGRIADLQVTPRQILFPGARLVARLETKVKRKDPQTRNKKWSREIVPNILDL